MAKKNARAGSTGSRNARPAAAVKKKGATKRKTTANHPGDSRIRDEIIFLIVLAFSILLFLSNFGISANFGTLMARFFFGLFGSIEYAFPVLLVYGYLFVLSNKGNPRLKRKMTGAVGLYLFTCAFFQLVIMHYDRHTRVADLFLDSAFDKSGGGLFGGLIVQLFGNLFGQAGAYVCVMIGLIIFAIIMTQEPLLRHLRVKSEQAYENAVESRAEHKARPNKEKRVSAFKRPKRRRAAKSAYSERYDDEEDLGSVEDLEAGRLKSPSSSASVQNGPAKSRAENQGPVIHGIFKTGEESAQTKTGEEPGRKKLQPQPAKPESAKQTPPVTEKNAKTDGAAMNSIEKSGKALMEALSTARSGGKRGKASQPSKKDAPSEQETTPAAVSPKPAAEDSGYEFPPLSLMKASSASDHNEGATREELKHTADMLQQTLHDFGVEVQVTDVSCGPTVTRYELHPEHGVKVSRILSLQDDIKLNLAAADIRIEAPIPGKAAVGIEVPNKQNSTVGLRELLESRTFRQSRAKIPFAVGKDIAGKTVVADIAKMPHLLIAGATGSGKSVCINTLIVSILYRARPEEVKFIMIDPKMVELSVYNGIPHLYIPVVTDPKKAAGALNWAVSEMIDRYNRFAGLGVRDIDGYNAKIMSGEAPEDGSEKPKKMPRIVIIVDELADLMMVAQHEVEDAIVRLSQLARAAGIHLVIATQRPSVNVITGLIKANMPSRIALAVTSGVDSRTILDMNGAEKLLGKGDMLFYPQGYQKPARVQGAFVSDEEISSIVSFLTEKNEKSEYDTEVEKKITEASAAGGTGSPEEKEEPENDVYFERAGKLIIEKDKASIGMLQRAFKIGFNRAARIMDQLCDAGVVGEEEGTKPRHILMTMAEFQNYLDTHET